MCRVFNPYSYQDIEDAPEPSLTRNKYYELVGKISYDAENCVANLDASISEFFAAASESGIEIDDDAIEAAKEVELRANNLCDYVEKILLPRLKI